MLLITPKWFNLSLIGINLVYLLQLTSVPNILQYCSWKSCTILHETYTKVKYSNIAKYFLLLSVLYMYLWTTQII